MHAPFNQKLLPPLLRRASGTLPSSIASPKGVDFDSINREFYVGFVEALERDCIGIGWLATVFCCFSLAFSFWKCFWGHSTPFGGICGRFPSAVQHFCGEFPRVWRILFVGVLPHLRLGFHSASQGYYFGVFFWTFIAVFQFQRVLGAGKHFLLVFSSLLYPRHQLGPTSLSFF